MILFPTYPSMYQMSIRVHKGVLDRLLFKICQLGRMCATTAAAFSSLLHHIDKSALSQTFRRLSPSFLLNQLWIISWRNIIRRFIQSSQFFIGHSLYNVTTTCGNGATCQMFHLPGHQHCLLSLLVVYSTQQTQQLKRNILIMEDNLLHIPVN